MNAPLVAFAPESSAPLASPPLAVAGPLRRFRVAVRGRVQRADPADERLGRRLAVLALLDAVAECPEVDTIASFERVLNGCLDLGYRTQPLTAFVFDVLQRRLAGRIRRRLASSGQDPECEEVADLVATTALAIQRLIRQADREQHSLRYALLLSIADHRTIDFLRRRRPEYRGTMDDRPAGAGDELWPRATDGGDPERRLMRAHRAVLALALRDAVVSAVNSLPSSERAALVLVEIEGLGYPAVADRLGLKRTDVGNVVRRARLRRDRALVPLLRDIPGLEGHVGFGDLQDDRDLRLSMLTWSAEIGDGLEVSPPEAGWRLTVRAAA
ncbi:MAG: hypothetical protein H6706_04615 [Myxococcales bacterium]|nr:hypothetical protein [Myxococcales bacterium]